MVDFNKSVIAFNCCNSFLFQSTRTHYAVSINGANYKFIKWCDVNTIDLEEVQSESWASIVPGKPMSPLLHQVILRDQAVNKGLMLYDTIPEKYRHE